MRCVMVMFDSLNRHMLPPYKPDTWVKAPNFSRLAERAATFDTSYVCSMPCMPARRDFHTGRPNFLHTAWGPLEPYDDSVPQMLKDAGVYTHLCSDHYHYWEDGGATYHGRYNSWESFRGQEGDPWIGQVAEPTPPPNINGKDRRQDWVNRPYLETDEKHPQSQTFRAGVEFIDRNHREDRWFLHLECFDPHEPFFVHRNFRDLYPEDPVGLPLFDWPPYWKITEPPEQVEAARRRYAALLSKCDHSLGLVLDAFDRHGLWKDTMLIVCTDHGYMLGEHGWWAKSNQPMYEELSRTPFFVWDPRTPAAAGTRRAALVQPSIDMGPTILGLFGLAPTERMLGHDLASVIAADEPVREHAIFGYHGMRVNITDGKHVLMRTPDLDVPIFQYTLMPCAMRTFKTGLDQATLHPPFPFTKNMPLLRIPSGGRDQGDTPEDLLYDVEADPAQAVPLTDTSATERLLAAMRAEMARCDAPPEQFERMRV